MASTPTRKHLSIPRMHGKCVTFKMGYASREDALDGCERSMDQGLVSPGCHLMPYACDQCGEWHIRNVRIVQVPPENLSQHDYRGKMRR